MQTKFARNKWVIWVTLAVLLFTLVSPAAAAEQEQDAADKEGIKLTPNIDTEALDWPKAKALAVTDELKKAKEAGSMLEGDLPFSAASRDGEAAVVSEPQNFVPASDSAKRITVIVELESDPLAVHKAKTGRGLKASDSSYPSKVDKEQSAFAAAAKGLNAKLGSKYKQAFNGYAVEIAANKVDSLLSLPGVKAIYPNLTYKVTPVESVTPNMDESAPYIGSEALWDIGLDGTGIKVGVLDTGVDYNHPSLKDAYKGGYDLVDEDNDPLETPPDPADLEAATTHGTHVSGTIVGRGDPTDPDSPTGWVKGVAYGADLYVYRVLGPGGEGTSEDVIAGVEKAVSDGMDIINLSLGDSNNYEASADSIALNNAAIAGVVPVVSNGNDGPTPFTVGNPGTSELSISVGASYPPLNVPAITGDEIGKVYGSLMSFSPELGELTDTEQEIVYVGQGTAAEFEGVDVSGKVALIERGTISFQEKSLNAQAAGAAAAIIFNNAPGNFGGTLGEEGDYIPTLSISQENGNRLVAAIGEGASYTAHFGIEMVEDLIADFSSRGPTIPSLSIKPDISAPGVGIRSSVPSYDGDYADAYEDSQGTSMAAPHIAGAAALLLQNDSSLTPEQVKGLLTNNAVELTDEFGDVYPHMAQGAGRVDLAKSIEAEAIAMVNESTTSVTDSVYTEYRTGSLSFGQVAAGSELTKAVTIEDIAGVSSAYTIDASWNGEAAGTLDWSSDTVTVEAGGSSAFNVTLRVDADAADDYYEGNLTLTSDKGHVLHIPFAVYVGYVELPEAVSGVYLDPVIFSPNGDGVNDTSDVYFDVGLTNSYFSLDVINPFTLEWYGMITEERAGIDPGSYWVEGWDSTLMYNDFPIDTEYPLSVFGDAYFELWPFFEDDFVVDQAAPFIIDIHAPETSEAALTVKNGAGTVTGSVYGDFLVDFFGDYSGISVAALTDDAQYDGVIHEDGTYEIEVPIGPGTNKFEIYVYDAALNGVIEPADVVTYEGGGDSFVSVAAVASADEAEPGESFSVSVDVYGAEDLYSAQFSLIYDASLLEGTVEPSVQLSDYQEERNPGTSLIIDEETTDIGGGKVRSDYIVSLAGDFGGYDGSGGLSLALYNFSGEDEGTYGFELANVRLINSDNEDIGIGGITGDFVTVDETPAGSGHTITGTITAEAFADGVDYSEVWYSGSDGKHQVIVEAVDADNDVAGIGTVKADGTYSIQVPAGTYTVRVVVPGHIAESDSVKVDGDTTHNFGPLAAGDVNVDGSIDLADLQLAAKEFGKSKGGAWPSAKTSAADINRDDTIDVLDVSFILNNFAF